MSTDHQRSIFAGWLQQDEEKLHVVKLFYYFRAIYADLMTTLTQIQQAIAPELDKLNTCIARELQSSNDLMNQVVDNYLKAKGKQIRPIMVILAAKMYGNTNLHVINAAAAVELLHNASLIHDDVVDDSKTRRSRPTVNAVWDNHIAVLVGDFFVSTSLHLAISTGDIRIIDSLARLGRLLSLGEIDQIYNARYHRVEEDAYFEVITRKTASLFMSCVEMGAYATGASDSEVKRIREFARLLGQAFQIKDDIFDYFSDETIGKPTGNDLREGKITLPLIHALTSHHPKATDMAEMSRRDVLTSDEINQLIEFAKEAGGIDYAYATMERLRDEAMQYLDMSNPVSEDFIKLFDYIIERKY